LAARFFGCMTDEFQAKRGEEFPGRRRLPKANRSMSLELPMEIDSRGCWSGRIVNGRPFQNGGVLNSLSASSLRRAGRRVAPSPGSQGTRNDTRAMRRLRDKVQNYEAYLALFFHVHFRHAEPHFTAAALSIDIT